MRKMKDSGIEWIGEIPENWDTIRVKHLATEKDTLFLDGDWINSDVIVDEGIRYLTSGNVGEGVYKEQGKGYISEETFNKLNCLTVYPGDLMISRLNEPVGRCCIVPEGEKYYVVAVDNVILRPNHNFHKKYLLYCMNTTGYARAALMAASGTTMQRISRTSLGNMAVPVASYEEQFLIADYLDQKCAEIDAIISAKEKTNELLKERRQSIIYEAVTKGLDPTVPMKDSGIEWIGEIPESWDVCPVKYVIDKNHPYPVGDGDHGLIKADDYLDEGIPYIRVLNLTWGEGLNLENLVYISDEMNSRIKNSELKPNDILIAKTGATIGKTAIVPVSLPRSNTTSHVGKITISSDHNAVFFYYVMTSSIVQKQIQDLSAMQSTRPELGIDGLRNLLVVVPPVEEQQDISEFLNQQCAEINSVIDTNKSMIDKLKEYRQSVIYEAVTGKVEI